MKKSKKKVPLGELIHQQIDLYLRRNLDIFVDSIFQDDEIYEQLESVFRQMTVQWAKKNPALIEKEIAESMSSVSQEVLSDIVYTSKKNKS